MRSSFAATSVSPFASDAQSLGALGAFVERDRAADARLDDHRVELLTALHRPALQLALLHVERLTVLGLGVAGDPDVAEGPVRSCTSRAASSGMSTTTMIAAVEAPERVNDFDTSGVRI